MFIACVDLVFGSKNMQFHIICLLQYSIGINTNEVGPHSDSLHVGSETQELYASSVILYMDIISISYICIIRYLIYIFHLFSLLLTRNELDNPHKKKTWKTFRFNFSVELKFLPETKYSQ